LKVGLFFEGWIDSVASITVGGHTIAPDVSTSRIIRLVLPVDPSTPLEAGAVTSAELADGAVTNPKVATDAIDTAKIAPGAVTDAEVNDVGAGKVTEDLSTGGSGLAFVDPDFLDNPGGGSRRPNQLRHSSGNLSADDAEDARARAQGGLTGAGNVKPGTLIGGDSGVLTASQTEDGADRARFGFDVEPRLIVDIHDGSVTILDISVQELFQLQLMGTVEVGSTSPENANTTRAAVVRAMEMIDVITGDMKVAGDVEEGVSGMSDGATVFGVTVQGDDLAVISDDAPGGGGGTGDTGGGDPEP